MTGYLLDTNVVSEMTKTKRNQNVKSWLDSQRASDLFISEHTVGELYKGVFHLPPSQRRIQVENWLEKSVIPMFDGRVLPINFRSWVVWGKLCGEALRRGRPLPMVDAVLAATAMEHKLTLATRDKALISLGVAVVNPWQA